MDRIIAPFYRWESQGPESFTFLKTQQTFQSFLREHYFDNAIINKVLCSKTDEKQKYLWTKFIWPNELFGTMETLFSVLKGNKDTSSNWSEK